VRSKSSAGWCRWRTSRRSSLFGGKRTTSTDRASDADGQHSKGAASPKPAVPAKLLDELLADKTLGLRVAMVDNPVLALRLVAFSLAAAFLGDASASCLAISVDQVDMPAPSRAENKAADEFAEIYSVWRSRLPANGERSTNVGQPFPELANDARCA
jgi:ParB family transcriptional regulator, chromosome partitioning protein